MVNLPTILVQLNAMFKTGNNGIQARFLLSNSGAGGASNIQITSVTLDGVPTLDASPGPINLASGHTSAVYIYDFPHSSKASGTTVLLKVQGIFAWYGTINATLRVQLP